MDFSQIMTAAITIVTLALMLVRPRGLGEAWFAAAGAVVLLIVRILPTDAPVSAIAETWTVLVFLAAMMVITGIVERAGAIEVVAERIALICGQNPRTLYIAMFALCALITATMSLDITIIMMVPILYALSNRRGLDPVPYLFACVFVANIGSLILPVSNLTNLLLVNRLDLSFAAFVRTMWFPNMVALLTTLVMFLWLFRREIGAVVATPLEDPIIARTGSRQWRSLIGWLLVATIGALLVCGFTEFPVWIPAAVGAVLMLALAVLQRRISLTQIVGDLSVPLFVFVVAMTMLVQAIETQFLTGREITPPLLLPGQIAGGVMAATMASNVINNVPATVIVGEVLATLPSGPRKIMAYASLVGANIGPALTTYGSLATMLWLSILRKRGLDISSRRYLRVSLVTVPAVLLTTSLALWVSLA